MTTEEYLIHLEAELVRERAKSASLEAELAKERAKSARLEADLAAVQAEYASLHVAHAQLLEQFKGMLARLGELEGRLAKDSHNSSKPPSSDGPARKRRRQRQASDKKAGGQAGHAGRTLLQVANPDEVARHRPLACQHCQQPLEGVLGSVKERRQVMDLPELRLRVREHQVEEVRCPQCQQVNVGRFPASVQAPVQYGPNVQALAVYLSQGQLVPLARTCELLWDVCQCSLSEGTLVHWVQEASEQLADTIERIADWLCASRLQHGDETGVRIGGKLHWLHVNCTSFLTHLSWHAKRGKQAMEAIGIWPRFAGRAMRDRLASYDQFACAHSLCGAHLVRDCVYVAEQEQQDWAADMANLLVSMATAAEQWRELGATCVPGSQRDEWVAQYFELLARGFAAQPPVPEQVPKQRGRRKQSAAKNLLDTFLRRAEQVLAFLDDLSIPFTNNQAERDLRMVKVQQKISGTFRSDAGATAFCRIRSYLSTMRKQGHSMLTALAAVFAGQPLPVAWEPK
jgi:transposase